MAVPSLLISLSLLLLVCKSLFPLPSISPYLFLIFFLILILIAVGRSC